MRFALSMLLLAAACGGGEKKTTTTTSTTTTASEPVVIEEESVTRTVSEEAEAPAVNEPAPEASPSDAPPVAALDKDAIRRVIRRNLSGIQTCYEAELLKQPGLQGTTTVSFTILPSGQVEAAVGAGFDATVDLCVANFIATLVFPASTNGTRVNYPFKFRADASTNVVSPTP